jgi:hypothetical protein
MSPPKAPSIVSEASSSRWVLFTIDVTKSNDVLSLLDFDMGIRATTLSTNQ